MIGRFAKYAENGANRDVDVDVGRAIERVEDDEVLGAVIGGRDVDALELFACDGCAVMTTSEDADDRD